MFAKFTRHKLIVIGILLLAVGLMWLIVRSLPATEEDLRRSTCFVEGKSYLCLASGKDTVVLKADNIRQQGVWINRHWWWPSCDGRVLTIDNGINPIHRNHLENPDTLKKLVAEGTDSLGRLLERKQVERKELIYYLRSPRRHRRRLHADCYLRQCAPHRDRLSGQPLPQAHGHEKHQVAPPLP